MKTALIAGASGLIGRELVQKLINSDQYRLIYSISRKKGRFVHDKIREIVINFEQIDQLRIDEPIDDVFCTLGTTMKQAGSRENFKKVDYGYVLELAKLGKKSGASKYLVVSAMGANPKSPVFYNQVKGLVEEELKKLGFKHLVILRPSLLLGERPVMRYAERLSGFLMKTLNIFIPDNYKAIYANKVADFMLKMALKSTGPITIIKSGEMFRD